MEKRLERPVIQILKIAIIIMLNICLIALITVVDDHSDAFALSRVGSRGAEVKAIQQRLTDLGLFSGKIDGIFGPVTEAAVKKFQKQKGLAVDGIAGPKTLAALGINPAVVAPAVTNAQADEELLARIISAEARGEPYDGQVAVGGVILNRVRHPSFPDTLAGVIYQNGAFSAVTDSNWNAPITDSARRAAKAALNGSDPSGGAIYYYNPNTATSAWIRSRPVIKRIGGHVFCA